VKVIDLKAEVLCYWWILFSTWRIHHIYVRPTFSLLFALFNRPKSVFASCFNIQSTNDSYL